MYPNLKMAIWLSGIRQNRLARDLRVDETVLSKVINGFRLPSPELRAALAAYLDRSENWLFQTELLDSETTEPGLRRAAKLQDNEQQGSRGPNADH